MKTLVSPFIAIPFLPNEITTDMTDIPGWNFKPIIAFLPEFNWPLSFILIFHPYYFVEMCVYSFIYFQPVYITLDIPG